MAQEIVIDGLDIEVVQKITGIKLVNARAVERTYDGVKWNGQVVLMSGDAPLGNRRVRQAIAKNTDMTFEELNVASQAVFTKDYDELTVIQAQQVQGQVLATKMITAINDAETGITFDDVNSLVTTIVTALA
jgi:hypothetical protein